MGTFLFLIFFRVGPGQCAEALFIQRAAKALEVSVADLVGGESRTARIQPGPPPQLALRFEQIRQLPRKDQEFVLKFLDTVLEKAGLE